MVVSEGEHASLAALRICVFAFLLIEISSRKAVPEVTSTFPGPLHQLKNNEMGPNSSKSGEFLDWGALEGGHRSGAQIP